MARRRADACYRELGAELRKRRIAANLTMRELAYHLDWSPSTVSRVESGYIGLPTTEVLPPPHSSRAIRFSGSAANTSVDPSARSITLKGAPGQRGTTYAGRRRTVRQPQPALVKRWLASRPA